MTTEIDEELVYSIAVNLVETGLNEQDIFNIAEAIGNQEIHSASPETVSEYFKNTVDENRKVAFRRTFGRNAVVFGPNGIAIIERDEVLFCLPYEKNSDGRVNFENATRIHGDYIVYNNDLMNKLYDDN